MYIHSSSQIYILQSLEDNKKYLLLSDLSVTSSKSPFYYTRKIWETIAKYFGNNINTSVAMRIWKSICTSLSALGYRSFLSSLDKAPYKIERNVSAILRFNSEGTILTVRYSFKFGQNSTQYFDVVDFGPRIRNPVVYGSCFVVASMFFCTCIRCDYLSPIHLFSCFSRYLLCH